MSASGGLHPCLPFIVRYETCLANATFQEECNDHRLDFEECYTQRKGMVYQHQLSKEIARNDYYVPVYDVMTDRFDGSLPDQTLNSKLVSGTKEEHKSH